MLRKIVLVASLAAALCALADEDPDWTAIIVRFDIDRDGRLHITEQATVDVPPSVQRLERTYWSDAEHEVTFDAITLYDGDRTVPLEDSGDLDRAHRYRQQIEPGKVVWSVRDKATQPDGVRSLTYVIESHVSDAVIPAWSIPPGNRSKDPRELSDVRVRLREAVALWREARKNPRHRFLVDYLYEMPPPSTKGTEIQLQIYWPPGWNPVHEITPDTVAREINRDSFHPDQWRVTHLFEEDGRHLLTSVDIARHAIRMAALAGFPIVALLFWLAFVLRELLLRRGVDDGEQLVRDVVYKETPEVIEARWKGRAPYVEAEEFVERVERKVGRTPFEETFLHLLKEKSENVDGTEMLQQLLTLEANATKNRRAPWYSRFTSFALFLTGAYFALQESVRYQREPIVLAAGLIASTMLFSIWPSSVIRDALRNSLKPSLFLLIPLAIMTALMIAAHFATEAPPGIFASGGLAAMLLGTYKAILASSATRDSRTTAQLARARRWLREELKSPAPRIHSDAQPWLAALGLRS